MFPTFVHERIASHPNSIFTKHHVSVSLQLQRLSYTPVVSYINTYIGVLLSALRVRLGTLVALSGRDGVWVPVLPRAPTSHAVGHGPKQTKTSLSRQGQPAVSTTGQGNSENTLQQCIAVSTIKTIIVF